MTVKPRCDRCGLRYSKEPRARQALWNQTMSRGVVAGYLCPDCQTPEESAEATINEATIDYAYDSRGRLIGRPKTEDTPRS